MARSHIKGQSLIEALVALMIGVVMIGGVSTVLVLSVRSSADADQLNNANRLASQELDSIRVLAAADWNAIYTATKYIDEEIPNLHYLSIVGVDPKKSFAINDGVQEATPPVDGITFTKSFYIENVLRDVDDKIVASDGIDDPSTQKITVNVTWLTDQSFKIVGYLIRSRNVSALFSDWSAGPGLEGPYTILADTAKGFSFSTNIDYQPESGGVELILQ
jgi:type II secretory pathway pseudopilin PulG